MAENEPTVPEWLQKEGFTVLPVDLWPGRSLRADTSDDGSQGTIAWFTRQMHDDLGNPTYEIRVRHLWQIQNLYDGLNRIEFFMAHAKADPRFDLLLQVFDMNMPPYIRFFEKQWASYVQFSRDRHIAEDLRSKEEAATAG